MKNGKIVWLSTHPNPFVISPSHCLDLDCPCTDVWLQMTEVDLDGQLLGSPLSFDVRACLRTWIEREPPRRSPEIDVLVRELLVEFPPEWVDELIEIRREQRAARRRFAEYKFESPRGELVCFSDIVSPDGGLASGGRHYGFSSHTQEETTWSRIITAQHRNAIAKRFTSSFGSGASWRSPRELMSASY